MAYNVSHVCDVALSPTRAKGNVAERRAAAPRSPRRLPRRRCTYVLLCAVAPLELFLFLTSYSVFSMELSGSPESDTIPGSSLNGLILPHCTKAFHSNDLYGA